MAKPNTKVSDESAEIIVNDQGVPVIAGADFKVRLRQKLRARRAKRISFLPL